MQPLPKKKLIERFRAEGAAGKVNEWLSAAYLLHSVAYNLYTDADDAIRSYGLRMNSLKRYANRLEQAYGDYFRDFVPLIESKEQQAAYWHDLEELQPVILRAVSAICGFEGEDEGKAEFQSTSTEKTEKTD